MDAEPLSGELPSPSPPRDLRLDLIRGVALLCMHTDHFRHNELALWTPRNFGFSDMAEMFVFLSGCACGIAYGKVLRANGWLRCQRKAMRRACQLVVACALTLLALAMVQFVVAQNYGASPGGWPSWSQLVVGKTLDWQTLQTIGGGSQVVGILSLYVMLLVTLPAMLWLREGHGSLLLGPSLVVYGATQIGWGDSATLRNWERITPFHPCAWQLIFALGILLYDPFQFRRPLKWVRWLWLIAALVVVEGAFVAKFWLVPDEIPLIDKTTLGPLRVLHVLAVLGLTDLALPDQSSGLWKAWPIRLLVLCGQNSLIVFCSGSVLVVLFENLLITESHALSQQIVTTIAVWGSCVLIAFAGQSVRSAWPTRRLVSRSKFDPMQLH